MNTITVPAPAKVNLVLEVLGKRDDGYHEICSLMQSVSLCDVLSFKLAESVTLRCDEPSLEKEDNLVLRAAHLLKEWTGYGGGVAIDLEKRIPWGAGLGGGSSDAAATLLTLNDLWQLDLSMPHLTELAAKLGSDVPFFLHKGLALVEGRGERVSTLENKRTYQMVILNPPIKKPEEKTKHLYGLLDQSHYTDGRYVQRAVDDWGEGQNLYNVFDSVAIEAFPGIEKCWKDFEEASGKSIHLCGSGPALFTVVEDEREAEEIKGRLHAEGYEVYIVTSTEPEKI